MAIKYMWLNLRSKSFVFERHFRWDFGPSSVHLHSITRLAHKSQVVCLDGYLFIYLFTSQRLPGAPGEFRIIPELMEINHFSRESPESPGKTDFLPVSVVAHLTWSYFFVSHSF